MSFICQKCGRPQPNRTKPVTVITKVRPDNSIIQQLAMCSTCAALENQVEETPLGTLGDNPALQELQEQTP